MSPEADKEITARLINWGLWAKGGIPKLGTPAFVEIMSEYFPQDTRIAPDEIDAQHIEEILSSLDIAGRGGMNWGDVWAFVCRLQFIEIERPTQAKAEHVRSKFKIRCSERTYRYHLFNARKAVHAFANPLNLPPNNAILLE